LSLNINKTNYVIFNKNYTENESIAPEEKPEIKFGNDIIEQKPHVKFLGLTIDENLKWNNHCISLYNKLSKGIYILRSAKKTLSMECMIMLYYSFIYSHIQYGIMLWGPSSLQKHINSLTKIQKNSVRVIKNAKYNAHTNNYFKELKILKIPDIIELELLKFTYCFVNTLLPAPLTQIFKTNSEFHDYQTRNRSCPRNFKHKSSKFHNSFLNKGPTLWSSLSKDNTDIINLKSFSKNFKTIKIDKY